MSGKIIDYMVMSHKDLSLLADVVRIMMKSKEGWQPLGGVTYASRIFFQTLVVYEPEQ